MPRPASDYTAAIRKLLDESDGAVTHGQSRDKLAKLGFPVAKQPKPKSKDLRAVDEYTYDENGLAAALRGKDEDGNEIPKKTATETITEILGDIFAELGFDEGQQKAVLAELRVRQAFYDERNNFDVTKYNWKQVRTSGKPTPSRKPTAATADKNKRAAAAKTTDSSQPPPKHRRGGKRRRRQTTAAPAAPATTTSVEPTADELAALALIEQHGGVGNVETRIQELRTEADQLQAAVDAVAELTKRSDELQQRIRAAA